MTLQKPTGSRFETVGSFQFANGKDVWRIPSSATADFTCVFMRHCPATISASQTRRNRSRS